MSMKNKFLAIAEEWLKKADSDLHFARASFEEFDDFYSQMCILCHDAAEKYLKGFIASCGVKPEKIHDLVTLLKECLKNSDDKEKLENLEPCCRTLNHYYTPLKYPSHYPSVTKEKAQEAIECTERIGNEITVKIRSAYLASEQH